MQSLSGRSLIEVSMEKVKELRELGFTRAKIADILHINRQTLYRRLDGSSDLICLCYSITYIIRVSFIGRNQRSRVPQFLCSFHCCLDSTEEGAP